MNKKILLPLVIIVAAIYYFSSSSNTLIKPVDIPEPKTKLTKVEDLAGNDSSATDKNQFDQIKSEIRSESSGDEKIESYLKTETELALQRGFINESQIQEFQAERRIMYEQGQARKAIENEEGLLE